MEARSQLRHRPTKEGTSFILLKHADSVKHGMRTSPEGKNDPTAPLGLTRSAAHSRRLPALLAQTPISAGYPVANLRPALANVQTAIGNLSIPRWKASTEVRTATQQDVASMQRDLTVTLPGLLSQVESQPAGHAALSPHSQSFVMWTRCTTYCSG